jgi:hypothetical protein
MHASHDFIVLGFGWLPSMAHDDFPNQVNLAPPVVVKMQ